MPQLLAIPCSKPWSDHILRHTGMCRSIKRVALKKKKKKKKKKKNFLKHGSHFLQYRFVFPNSKTRENLGPHLYNKINSRSTRANQTNAAIVYLDEGNLFGAYFFWDILYMIERGARLDHLACN